MFENLGPAELLLIFVVILIFFGPKKIPELASSLGKGLRKFNSAKEGFETHVKTAMKEPMDAINEAKSGFEAKLLDASKPLRDTLMPLTATAVSPTTLNQMSTPAALPDSSLVDPNLPPAPLAVMPALHTDIPLFIPPVESLPRGTSIEESPTPTREA